SNRSRQSAAGSVLSPQSCVLLLRPGDVENSAAGVPDAEAADEGGDGAAEAAELIRRLGLIGEETAEIAQGAVQALGPGWVVVVWPDIDDLEVGALQKAVHVFLRVAKLGEPQPLLLPAGPVLPQAHEDWVDDEAPKRVVEGDHDEEQTTRFEHA